MIDLPYIVSDLDTHTPSKTGVYQTVLTDADGNILCSGHLPVISGISAPRDESITSLDCASPIFIGGTDKQNWWVHRIEKNSSLPPGHNLIPLRTIATSLSPDLLAILGRAVQLARFDQITSYCGRCGAQNLMKEDELAKQCPVCGLLTFPRLSPAIIVRITNGDKILLARSPHFPSGMYSVVAGFVEPGESIETGVHREVFEEVGVRITDLKYYASQPWPFPDSLMLGFVAKHLSGDIRCDGVEIEDARWFNRENIPELPGPLSIARALIDDFIIQ